MWKELSSAAFVARSGTGRDAVEHVRQALLHKERRPDGTLLLLDAAHVGAIISPSLVENYLTIYGDPEG